MLEHHLASCTPAKTFFILPSNAEYIYSKRGLHNTHWHEYYKVPRGVKILGVRISNSGIRREKEIVVTDHTYVDFLLKQRPLSSSEVESIRVMERALCH